MEEEFSIVRRTEAEISPASIKGMLILIRPVWQGKGLIKRVEILLPIDPGSACQRLFNAAIYDLREKIVTVGIDIAKEVAKTYRLPPIEKDDDILENYSTYNVIDLSYRMGILRRPEWRRIQRCYEIRRDLEHEDNEYEAVLEDCFYIFKSTIEVVLSQDPVEILKVTDVKQVIEEPQRITITEELLTYYSHAPELRQKEIIGFLVATAKSTDQPDVIRENSFELLRHFKTTTKTQVIIEIAKELEKRLDRNEIDLVTAKIGHAIGATAYFKRAKLKDYYSSILRDFKNSSSSWSKQAKIVSIFHDIGHFTYCPKDLIVEFLKYLVLCYIGEPGGYGTYGRNRAVFFSDAAAPIIKRIIKNNGNMLSDEIKKLRKDELTPKNCAIAE
ncbi:MAG: hypothetical protein JW749_06865 [Sedimentisphaerales bacterium]|nr:hypothetical protein [Sedimentisphaerales bacterium]